VLIVDLLIEEEKDEEKKEEQEEKPYAKWRSKSSKVSVLISVKESTVKGWVKKGDNERNTFEELRYCSGLCAKKTEEKDVAVLFILVKTSRKLNKKLSDV
jgi:hypothetical protein